MPSKPSPKCRPGGSCIYPTKVGTPYDKDLEVTEDGTLLLRGEPVTKENGADEYKMFYINYTTLKKNCPDYMQLRYDYCHEKGVEMICLSLGPDGALLSTKDQAFFCPAADVPVLGTQGAGDSMLGALLLSLHRGDSLPKALCFASAAAGASIQRPGTLLCTREATLSLLPSLSARAL